MKNKIIKDAEKNLEIAEELCVKHGLTRDQAIELVKISTHSMLLDDIHDELNNINTALMISS